MHLFLYQTLKKCMSRKIYHIVLVFAWLFYAAGYPVNYHSCGDSPMIAEKAMDPEICYVAKPGTVQNGIFHQQICSENSGIHHTCKNKLKEAITSEPYLPSAHQISFHQVGEYALFYEYPPHDNNLHWTALDGPVMAERLLASGANSIQSFFQVFRL